MLKIDQCYYVDMPQNLTMIEEQLEETVNLDEVTLELVQETHNPPNVTQEAIKLNNLLSLLHLHAMHTRGKKPLVDYSQSHVVTSTKYLNVLRKKSMDKVVIGEIKEG